MGKLKYKGYTGSVDYSAEDECLYGKVEGLHGTLISYEGQSIEEIKSDFEGAVDDYLESCKARGIEPAKPYSGKLLVRMPSVLHERIAQRAAETGMTINEWINRAMENEVTVHSIVASEPESHYQ